MIAFSCARCGMKLKVKTEFAGRSSKCPTCKQPLTVPQPSPTEAVPAGEISGSASSLAVAGVEGGVLLEQTVAVRDNDRSLRDLLAQRAGNSERDVIEREIARGGMGAVLRASIATSAARSPSSTARSGRSPQERCVSSRKRRSPASSSIPTSCPSTSWASIGQKRLFFSMKMVKGRSLAQVLDALRKEPKTAEKEFSLAAC